MWTVTAFDAAAPEDATRALTECCASQTWAAGLAAARPYRTYPLLKTAALAAFDRLDQAEVDAACAAHPPIGRPCAGDRWSGAEQSRALAAGAAARTGLADANAAYEQRFGRVFLICAAGLTADEVLAQARRRLRNDLATELAETRAELRKITALRLDRTFIDPAPATPAEPIPEPGGSSPSGEAPR